MKPLRRIFRVIVTLMALALIGMATVTVIGSIRYGSPDLFIRRVRAEIAVYQPHPDFVPTPLASAATVSLAELTAGDSPAATPSPTAAVEQSTASISTPAPADSGQPPTETTPPTDIPAPTATPTPAYQPARESVQLAELTHMWQTWNNCGPATLAMNLSYYACDLTQAEIAAALKPDVDDKNVSPEEMADFARRQNLSAHVLVNGDADRLRLLLSNGVPVLIETWHEPAPDDGMGHYRLLMGYDDAARQWVAYDSYESKGVDPDKPYAGIRFGYDGLDALWRVFNRAYLVIYDEAHAPAARDILGADLDETQMWQRANRQAQMEIEAKPNDPFGWFNLGMGLAAGGQFERAASAFDQARHIGLPWRMLWYQFGPFEAYFAVGRYDELIALADATLKTSGGLVEELYYWKGRAHEALGDTEAARAAWVRALELNGYYAPAMEALGGLTEASAP